MKKIPNDQLALLLEKNLSRVSEQERVFNYKEDFNTEKSPKLNGMTYGKFASNKDGKLYLIKKSARTQDLEGQDETKHVVSKTPSRTTVLINQYKESFEEVCAARIFSFIKGIPDYLPEISLCQSTFTSSKDKPYNNPKIAAGLTKIYVASEIIGSEEEKNLDRKRLNKEVLEREIKLSDDLCENAVIMMILMNYDLKLDNFVITEKGVIPIDFGNARYEEKLNPDIISAIDEIRNTSARNDSNRFSSKNLKEKFTDRQSESTRKFYRENLKPEHFLKVIERIENDPNYEAEIRNLTRIYSFGNEADKTSHAEVLLARSQFLVNLKSIFVELDNTEQEFQKRAREETKESKKGLSKSEKRIKKFSDCNLRAEISKNAGFETIAKSISDKSLVLDFYQFICEFFEKNLDYIQSISETDEKLKNNPNDPNLSEELYSLRNEYNGYLEKLSANNGEIFPNKIAEIESAYRNCTYFKTKQWEKEKEEMADCFDSIISTARQPFFSDNIDSRTVEYEYDFDLKFDNTEDNSLVNLESLENTVKSDKQTLTIKVKELITHLISFDIMEKISEKAKNATPSEAPTNGTITNLKSTSQSTGANIDF